MTKNLLRISLIFLFIMFSRGSFAFSAIAAVDGHFKDTWGIASNYATQKKADDEALKGCRNSAKTNGLQTLAKQCELMAKGKGPGYGAIVCSVDGCSWTLGYNTGQEAVDAAYASCSKSYSNCQQQNIQFYEDFAGYTSTPQNTANDCRPRSNSLRCSSSCSNGDCIVSYENGCKMRVQVQPRFNGFTNTWEYPAPNC